MEGKKFRAQSPARTQQQPPSAPPPGYVMFRILCDVSQVGHVIGKSGRMIKELQETTKSLIWIETPDDSLYRLITIYAHVGLTSRVKLGVVVNYASNKEKEQSLDPWHLPNLPWGRDGAEKEEQEQEVEVSRAQGALIRVFEVLNFRFWTTSSVSCRLLIEGSHVVTVIGNGGELMQRIWRETGCNVEIRSHDLPICAKPGDVMLKIEGNVMAAVKKALVSISSHLQACQPMASLHSEAVPCALRRTMDVVPREASCRSRQYREVDPRDSLQRHAEISQEDALNQVTSMPREYLINQSFQMGSYFPFNYANPCIRPEDPFPNWFSPTTGYAPNSGRRSTMDLNDMSHHSSQASSRLWASPPPTAPRSVYGSEGLSSTRDDHLGLESGLKPSMVIRNKTVRYRVSEDDVSSMFGYGKDGHNRLQKSLREISGAFVQLLEPYPGRMMDITFAYLGHLIKSKQLKTVFTPFFLR
ncbi:unnamed protein product [Arabidopsis arenosa]|uniref:K Homology domain-containing protein n=1 Tax=Arabidopsis arenosa TaxID=38785 RepID=A0A8S2AG00_ARAAE|nr:unnamed protein product [Arabidopsis arenosa]